MVEVGCAVECARSFELGEEDPVARLAYRGCHVIFEKGAHEDNTSIHVLFVKSLLIKVTRRHVFDVKAEVRGIGLGGR